jgi:3-deoxy-D-manno-octulosonic-acid transferase
MIKSPEQSTVLIIDSIGLLSKLYRYATIAYVGGGFNKAGIHNILEAAVYGNIVLFGSNFSKSNEAKEMIDLSVAYSFSASDELVNIIETLFNNPEQMNQKNLLILIYYWYRHIMTCEMRLSEYECKAIKMIKLVDIKFEAY